MNNFPGARKYILGKGGGLFESISILRTKTTVNIFSF